MRAFVVRPFGIKEGIDFDAVDKQLIQPALKGLEAHGYSVGGGTTGEISRQGNIREDMFRLIVASDLVIADVSIHNANAFYELGIRHALQPRHTFLLRSKTDQAYPFDLQTDRYFQYDAKDPGASVAALVDALRATLASRNRDSPVFALLPALAPHGRGQLVQVPADFREDVERALRDGQRGDLRLYAQEATWFEWDQEALRLIGNAQFKLRSFAGARETFEILRQAAPDDVQANLRLGTIYQRLTLSDRPERKEELRARSDHAIERVLADRPSLNDRVEAYSLQASNEKSRWIEDFSGADKAAIAAAALRSPHLEAMLRLYLKAGNLNLNAHYPLVNALALLKVQVLLAARAPDAWNERFDDDDKAKADLTSRETLIGRLTACLILALEMDDVMGLREGERDPWATATRADLRLLTASDRPDRVRNEYRRALTGADRFTLEAARRNLAIYRDLSVFEPGVSAALAVIDELMGATEGVRELPECVILFTGHMIDAPGRKPEQARFPATAGAEAKARELIEEALAKEVERHDRSKVLGIAGGACGSDILFHEACERLGIETRLYLAIPEDKFQVASVQRGGPGWVERYRRLVGQRAPRVMQESEALPSWLAEKKDYNVWQRNNFWMMFHALASGARERTFVALYNKEREPDGPGGTGHLVEEAGRWGFKPVELDARKLLTT